MTQAVKIYSVGGMSLGVVVGNAHHIWINIFLTRLTLKIVVNKKT